MPWNVSPTGIPDYLTPGPQNAMLPGWAATARKVYTNAGYGPAGAAQAALRARNRGWLSYVQPAEDYWRDLMNLATAYQRRAAGIDTTADEAALLQGGLQGMQAILPFMKMAVL